MNIQIHSIKFDADSKLLAFIQKKMDKMETFYDRVVSGEVYLNLNNEGINNKSVEIKLNIPGDQLFSESSAKTFETATKNSVKAMKRQLKKVKQKMIAH